MHRDLVGHYQGCVARMQKLETLGKQLVIKKSMAEQTMKVNEGAMATIKGLISGLKSNDGTREQMMQSIQRAQGIQKTIETSKKVIVESTGKMRQVEQELLSLRGRKDTLAQVIQMMRVRPQN